MELQQGQMYLEHVVSEKDDNTRLSVYLKKAMGVSSTCIKRAKTSGEIKVNNVIKHTDYIVKQGQTVSIRVPDKMSKAVILSADMNLEILYEDDYLVCVDKRQGILCHPIAKSDEDTIANGLKFLYPDMGIHPVNRLDRDTTGVVIFAKSSLMHHIMTGIDIEKIYIGMTYGCPEQDIGTINNAIKKVENTPMLRTFDKNGKPSITHYEVIFRCEDACIISFMLETGRTHQIRVHCKESGFSLIGDNLYGTHSYYNNYIKRQALHAYKTSFIHPITHNPVVVISELLEDMAYLKSVIMRADL